MKVIESKDVEFEHREMQHDELDLNPGQAAQPPFLPEQEFILDHLYETQFYLTEYTHFPLTLNPQRFSPFMSGMRLGKYSDFYLQGISGREAFNFLTSRNLDASSIDLNDKYDLNSPELGHAINTDFMHEYGKMHDATSVLFFTKNWYFLSIYLNKGDVFRDYMELLPHDEDRLRFRLQFASQDPEDDKILRTTPLVYMPKASEIFPKKNRELFRQTHPQVPKESLDELIISYADLAQNMMEIEPLDFTTQTERLQEILEKTHPELGYTGLEMYI